MTFLLYYLQLFHQLHSMSHRIKMYQLQNKVPALFENNFQNYKGKIFKFK